MTAHDARDSRTDPGEGDGTGGGATEALRGTDDRATGGVYTGPPIEFEDPPGLVVPPRVQRSALDGDA